MRRLKRIILPHEEHGHRAHAVSHSALVSYVLFLLIFLSTFQFLSRSTGIILGYAANIYREEILKQTNLEREKRGLLPLALNEQLNSAAQSKAEDMFKDDYWAHIAPGGTKPWFFIEESGYSYIYAGENLAKDFNDSEAVVRAWMNSASHRDNILGKNYQDIGIAVINGELNNHKTTLVVQLFGGKTKELATAKVETEKTSEYVPRKVEVALQEEAKTPFSQPQGISRFSQSQFQSLTEASLPSFDSANFVRGSVAIFGVFILFLFALDGFVATKRGTPRLTGKTLAHVGLLLFLLLIVWQVNIGVIL